MNGLKELKKNLKEISQEMYGISEIINVKEQMKLKIKNEKNKAKLKKDLEIMIKSIKTNKNKYEKLFEENEKETIRLEQRKDELLLLIRKQENINKNDEKKIKEFYGKEILMNEKEK